MLVLGTPRVYIAVVVVVAVPGSPEVGSPLVLGVGAVVVVRVGHVVVP